MLLVSVYGQIVEMDAEARKALNLIDTGKYHLDNLALLISNILTFIFIIQ